MRRFDISFYSGSDQDLIDVLHLLAAKGLYANVKEVSEDEDDCGDGENYDRLDPLEFDPPQAHPDDWDDNDADFGYDRYAQGGN